MAGNNAFSSQGATPQYGLGFNQPKQSGIMSGMQAQTPVANPLTGGGQPKTLYQTPSPQPQGAPMPQGWSSGMLGNTSLTPNTTPAPQTGNIPGLLDQYKNNAPVSKLVNKNTGEEVHFDTSGSAGATGGTSTGGTAGTATPPAQTTPVGQIAGQIQTSANAVNTPDSRLSQAYQNVQNLTNEYATQEKAIQGAPIPLEFQQGRGQVVANQYGTQEQAAQQGISNALAGQQQQIAGLGTAGGLVQPQPYGITTTPYQPATNTFGTMPGGAGGVPNAGQTLGNLASAQTYQQTLLPAYNSANSVLGNLDAFLQQNPNINPSQLNIANQANAWLQGGQLSIPQYPELAQYLNEITNTISPIVGSPGAVTNFKQGIVSAMIDPSASTSSILQQVHSLFDNIVTPKMDAYAKTFGGNGPSGNNQGGGQNTPINSSVVPGNYTMENGKWVYNPK